MLMIGANFIEQSQLHGNEYCLGVDSVEKSDTLTLISFVTSKRGRFSSEVVILSKVVLGVLLLLSHMLGLLLPWVDTLAPRHHVLMLR